MSKHIHSIPKLGETGVTFEGWRRQFKAVAVLDKSWGAIDPGFVEIAEDGTEEERAMKREEVEKNDNAHAALTLTIHFSLQPWGDNKPRARDYYLSLVELFSGIGESRQEELREQLANFKIGDEKAAVFMGRATAIWAEAQVIKSNIAEGEVVGALLRGISAHHNPEFKLIGSIILTSPGGMGGRPSLIELGKRLMIVDKAADRELKAELANDMHSLAAYRGRQQGAGGGAGSVYGGGRGGPLARGGGHGGVGSMGGQPGRGGGVCFDFQNGRCTRGNSCRYSHECDECHQLGHGRGECPVLASRKGAGQQQRAAAYAAFTAYKGEGDKPKGDPYEFLTGF